MVKNRNVASVRPKIRSSYKRPFDLTILILAHLLFLPLWLLLWTLIPIAIWLGDRGPIFYRQQRTGKDGRVFTIFKFRTMVPDAYQKGPAWTIENDVRLTRVGKFLRRTAMDELPGLWSIMKGDMSLVGPRALNVEEHKQLEQEIPGFEARLCVKPGLTGMAQVFDSADQAEDKLAYDLQYAEDMSLWLDAKLLILSVRNTITARWDRRVGKPTVADVAPSPHDTETHRDGTLENRQPGDEDIT